MDVEKKCMCECGYKRDRVYMTCECPLTYKIEQIPEATDPRDSVVGVLVKKAVSTVSPRKKSNCAVDINNTCRCIKVYIDGGIKVQNTETSVDYLAEYEYKMKLITETNGVVCIRINKREYTVPTVDNQIFHGREYHNRSGISDNGISEYRSSEYYTDNILIVDNNTPKLLSISHSNSVKIRSEICPMLFIRHCRNIMHCSEIQHEIPSVTSVAEIKEYRGIIEEYVEYFYSMTHKERISGKPISVGVCVFMGVIGYMTYKLIRAI